MNAVYPSRAAERVLFLERFENSAKVHANGGVITGGAVPKNGLPLDGLTQYAQHTIGATQISTSQLSWIIEFTPDFDWDDDAYRFLFETNGLTGYRVYKSNNAAGNVLSIRCGLVTILDIPSATWSSCWLIGKRNRLVVSSESGATDAWLNGSQVVTADASVWSPTYPETITIGADKSGASPFVGTIHSIKFRAGLTTQLDVDAIQSNSLYTYPNRASVWLDMKEATAKAGTIRGTTEELVDGDMEAAGVGDWAAGGGGSITKTAISPKTGTQALRISGGTGAVGRQAVNNTITGRRYRNRGWLRSDGINTPAVIDAFTAVVLWQGTTSTAWQFFDVTAVAGSSGFGYRWVSGAGAYIDVDDCSVVETDELLSDSDMEATGVGEWTASGTATLTKDTVAPYKGLQSLKVSSTSFGYAYQSILTAGVPVHITGRARSAGVGNPLVRDNLGTLWTGSASTDWQEIDVIVTPAAVQLRLWCNSASSTYVEFDNLSVRPVLSRTLDKSKYGRVCLLGDGFTAADIPDFLGTGKGFSFDGVSQYMEIVQAGGVLNNAGQSFAFVFKPEFDPLADVKISFLDSTDSDYVVFNRQNFFDNSIAVTLGGTFIGEANDVTYMPYWRQGGRNVLVVASESGSTDMRLNGALIMDGFANAWTPTDVSEIYLGRNVTGAQFFEGDLYYVCMFPFKLSPLQQRDMLLALGVIP